MAMNHRSMGGGVEAGRPVSRWSIGLHVVPALLVGLALAATVALVERTVSAPPPLPEAGLARRFVEENGAVAELFGVRPVVSVPEDRVGTRQAVAGSPETGYEGRTVFDVRGREGKGSVAVYWSSGGDGRNFVVSKLALIEPNARGLRETVLWEFEGR